MFKYEVNFISSLFPLFVLLRHLDLLVYKPLILVSQMLFLASKNRILGRPGLLLGKKLLLLFLSGLQG